MNNKELEEFFYRIVDHHLLDSLDTWQINRIKIMVVKAIKKGMKVHYQSQTTNQ